MCVGTYRQHLKTAQSVIFPHTICGVELRVVSVLTMKALLLKVMAATAVLVLVVLAGLGESSAARCQGFWDRDGTGTLLRKNCLGPDVRERSCFLRMIHSWSIFKFKSTLLKGYGTCDTEVIKSKRTNQSCNLKLVDLQTSFQDTLSDWLRAELTDVRGGKMCFSLEGETGKVALSVCTILFTTYM